MPEDTEALPFPIVGIGASAGGIEAFGELFRAMPADSGLGFIVVTHLAPGRESSLADIIRGYTKMPVLPARDGLPIASNHVYVLVRDAYLTVEGGRLHLRAPKKAERPKHPIDRLFASLAEDRGARAVGIVLSGSGSDGTIGIRAIKERGGLTIVQGRGDGAPRFEEMPASAFATGRVDILAPAAEIPAKLVAFARGFGRPWEASKKAGAPGPSTSEARTVIAELLRNRVGHDFSHYKEENFLHRVQLRMQVLQIDDLGSYIERLRSDMEETQQLFHDLLIAVTYFFRDPEAFEALERLVIPRLFQDKGASDVVRLWVPGCATGEEVYSLAILLREQMDTLKSGPKVQIFATDIDDSALAVARAAKYPASFVEEITPERLARFFAREGAAAYSILQELRDLCIFSSHSLIRDPPFSKIGLISCRNLLIYFEAELQRRVLELFHYVLVPGGYLFLGSTERIEGHRDLFKVVDDREGCPIYRRCDETAVAQLTFPIFLVDAAANERLRAVSGSARAGIDTTQIRRLEARILGEFAPAHVLVNQDGEILHFSAGTGKYLEPAVGAPSRQLVAMARRGLRAELSAALREVIESRRKITRENLAFGYERKAQRVALTIEPFGEVQGEQLYLVVFRDQGRAYAKADEAATPARDRTVEELEQELGDVRARLQTSIEEYDTAIEELKAANEEMVSVNEESQATNEELETSKEELQSVNEEIQTVNLALQQKICELDRANADLCTLFNSTQTATIFLDRNLKIRSFTPATTAIFNLIASDHGRPLTDIVNNIAGLDLGREIAEVLGRGRPAERRVHAQDGLFHYLMRILPYMSSDNGIEGVVVTFTDLGTVVRGEEQVRRIVAAMDERVEAVLGAAEALAKGEPGSPSIRDRMALLVGFCRKLAQQQWRNPLLADVVENVVTKRRGDGRHVTVDGPNIPLPPNWALALLLALGGIAASSARPEATPEAGRVEISWSVQSRPGRDRLVLRWREEGVASADCELAWVRDYVRRELKGEAEISPAERGFEAKLDLPLPPAMKLIGEQSIDATANPGK